MSASRSVDLAFLAVAGWLVVFSHDHSATSHRSPWLKLVDDLSPASIRAQPGATSPDGPLTAALLATAP